ncbi:CbtA family protein [Oricola indica]|jgi:cobalt transporter subunit CbtA|uniref:CbtA family protein n=1 Tax=Oricola indica TaxID=2872591 RepID=UPI001CC06975|nr:CbtA family protein [Oricola indica]
MLTRVILAALVAGLLAGVFATAAQSVRVIPLILQAEAYEEGVSHAETEDEVWAPEEGLQRTFFTLLSNLVTGVAFALILTAIILILDQPVSLRHGALWGAGGFAVFVLAPNFGLPPELPGMASGDLTARQAWWIATVLLTGGGLLIFAFKDSVSWMGAGVMLIVAPHVYGAPQNPAGESAVPAELAAEFAIATVVTSALFWLFLGAVLGQLLSRVIEGRSSEPG